MPPTYTVSYGVMCKVVPGGSADWCGREAGILG